LDYRAGAAEKLLMSNFTGSKKILPTIEDSVNFTKYQQKQYQLSKSNRLFSPDVVQRSDPSKDNSRAPAMNRRNSKEQTSIGVKRVGSTNYRQPMKLISTNAGYEGKVVGI
jgi:hypothetical protein